MRTPREFVLASTIAGLFSSAAVIDVGFGFQAWYAVMAINFLLLVWLGAVRVRGGMWLLAAALLASGAIGFAQRTDTAALFGKQIAGILATVLYFSCYFRLAGDDAARCFRAYVRGAYYVSIAGMALVLGGLLLTGAAPRLQSALSEPADFALAALPAAYYSFDCWRRERSHGREAAVIATALLLSRSSVAYLGLLFGLVLVALESWKRAVPVLAAAGVAGMGLYQVSGDFRLRLDDTVRAVQTLTVEDANLSTFALVSNAFVTARALERHPVAGNGLGSHLLTHRAYIADVPGVAVFENMTLRGRSTMDQLNAADANSLLLRLLSETGIAGALLVVIFIARYRRRGAPGGEAAAINSAVLVYFFVKLLRAGHYFSPEQFFFVFAYWLTGRRGAPAGSAA